MSFSSQNLLAILNGVTVLQRDAAEKLASKAGGLSASLSAYIRTGRKANATLGALAYVYTGILETLAHGQKSKLAGFAIAAKRSTPEFRALVDMGVLSEAGAVLAGVEQGFQSKPLECRAIDFVAAVLATAATIREADKASRIEAAPTEAAPTEAAPTEAAPTEAAPTEALTPGQLDNAAVQRIVARIDVLSSENIDALRAALAAHGAAVLAAAIAATPAPVPAPAPAKRARKASASA